MVHLLLPKYVLIDEINPRQAARIYAKANSGSYRKILLPPETNRHPMVDMTDDERGPEATELYSDRLDSL